VLFKNKGIPDATVLRLVAKILEKNQTAKGYKVKTRGGEQKLTADEVVKFVIALAERFDDGRYGAIRRCDTCGNFSRSGAPGKRGWCSPKEHSLFRNKTDYCSNWTPMTPEQKHIKEAINGYFKPSQTK
jgi:hypothetical protein